MDLSRRLSPDAGTGAVFYQTVKSGAGSRSGRLPVFGQRPAATLGAEPAAVASVAPGGVKSSRMRDDARPEPSSSAPAAAPRSRCRWRDGRVRLDRLFQQGCAKALLPRARGPRAGGGADQHRRRGHRRRPHRLAPRGRPRRRARRHHPGGRAGLPLGRRRGPDRDPARRSAPAPGSTGCRRRPSSSTPAGSSAASRSRWPADARLLALETLVLGRAAHGRAADDRRRRRPVAHPPRRPPGPRRGAARSTATSPAPPPAPRPSPAPARSPRSSDVAPRRREPGSRRRARRSTASPA